MGYDTEEISISLSESITKNIELSPKLTVVDSIIVTAEIAEQNIRQVEMGSFKLQPAKIRKIPVLFGEQDILKTIQLMPGVKSANEGGSGFSVRGGGTDQNLILLDEAKLEKIWRHTSGWCVNLGLIIEVLRQRSVKGQIRLDDLAFDLASLSEYIEEEVFDGLSPEFLDFLIRSSIFEDLLPENCLVIFDSLEFVEKNFKL